jgi:hypothetical protein
VTGLVVAVSCSEPGAREGLERFLADAYKDKRPEVVAVPGGSWWLARATGYGQSRIRRWAAQSATGAIRESVHGWLSRTGLVALEIVGHENCEWYRRQHPHASAGDLVRLQGDDLVAAATEAASLAPCPVHARFITATGEVRTVL